MCGIVIEHEGPKILSIKGDKEDALSKGHICPKAWALEDILNDPDRLKRPVERTPDGFKEISWESAFEKTVNGLKKVQKKYGNNSVAIYQGNPTVHNHGSILFAPFFIKSLKTKNRFSASSVDQMPHHFASNFMFGDPMILPVGDIDHTDFMIIMGANPVASNGSLMSAPGFRNRIIDLHKRGGRSVLIDPRKTETGQIVSQHHYIIPGSDVYFLLALLNSIFSQNMEDKNLPDYIIGLDKIRELVRPYTPDKVEERTGLAAQMIISLAREFSKSKTAFCYGRIGVCTQEFGTSCIWLINVLNIISGNFDRIGGAMLATPAISVVAGKKKIYKRWYSRVSKHPEFFGELPVSCLSEEMLTEGDGQIKAFVTSSGNPALSTPNGQKLEAALANLEFMVSIDFYINETTKHANIILPPTCALEHDHYDLAFLSFAVRNFTKYSPAFVTPEKGAKHDYEIFLELIKRMKRSPKWLYSGLKLLGPNGLLTLGLLMGPYHLLFSKLKTKKHGIDLGPLKKSFPKALKTINKKLNLAPAELFCDKDRLKEKLSMQKNEFLLIGRRNIRSNNSWMHNYKRLMKGKDRCTAIINSQDAIKKGITDGQKIIIRSKVGEITIPAEISHDIKPGVISIPHGFGHGKAGTNLTVANEFPGVNVNDLSNDSMMDLISGNAVLNGIPVQLDAVRL